MNTQEPRPSGDTVLNVLAKFLATEYAAISPPGFQFGHSLTLDGKVSLTDEEHQAVLAFLEQRGLWDDNE